MYVFGHFILFFSYVCFGFIGKGYFENKYYDISMLGVLYLLSMLFYTRIFKNEWYRKNISLLNGAFFLIVITGFGLANVLHLYSATTNKEFYFLGGVALLGNILALNSNIISKFGFLQLGESKTEELINTFIRRLENLSGRSSTLSKATERLSYLRELTNKVNNKKLVKILRKNLDEYFEHFKDEYYIIAISSNSKDETIEEIKRGLYQIKRVLSIKGDEITKDVYELLYDNQTFSTKDCVFSVIPFITEDYKVIIGVKRESKNRFAEQSIIEYDSLRSLIIRVTDLIPK
jgi:hypothetical protein